MKLRRFGYSAVLGVAVLVLGASVVFAAKPQHVIELSNGYPSGAHYNLNIHGKKAHYNCDPSPGGNSIFILEHGASTLELVSNKKASLDTLTAIDRCAEAFDGDAARVQLPSEEQGYYVFATVKAKPRNGSTDGTASSILVSPNPILRACNDTVEGNPDFPTYTECPDDGLLALGLVTNQGVYELTEQGFVRFDDASSPKGKGRSKATDITGLFLWSGHVCESALDVNGDGVINEADVPVAYETNEIEGIQPDEFDAWLADQTELGTCTSYENEWVFNVADLVMQDHEINNDGVKLLKVRFYPVATTEFVR